MRQLELCWWSIIRLSTFIPIICLVLVKRQLHVLRLKAFFVGKLPLETMSLFFYNP